MKYLTIYYDLKSSDHPSSFQLIETPDERKKQRSVYAVISVDCSPLSLQNMIEINALLCVRNFGHTPVLVIDDVNSSNFEKSNYDEEIEDIVREVAKIFFHQQQMKFSGLSHFELPGKNSKRCINNIIKFNIFLGFIVTLSGKKTEQIF